ncbi:hypothetical protein J11TS1_27030 [Oceanobacillus sp. J11TS1]|nr:hypothetical protein J11TS1_27030 [Oceanobacillus sp. J11TS1]
MFPECDRMLKLFNIAIVHGITLVVMDVARVILCASNVHTLKG